MSTGKLKELFIAAVREDQLFGDEETLSLYSRDMTECPAARPDIVVMLETAAQAEAAVRVAAANRIPLIPRVAGTNLGGLSIPIKGGAILDLTRMNRILAINEIDMIAVIEPGVSFQQLVDEIRARELALTIGIPLAPPNASVVANCLLDGLGNLSLLHGTMGEWITGLEVILATGDVARTGAWSVSDVPFSRAPLPDLTGLFISWQGATGLVTKMAVELKPNPPYRKRMFVFAYDRRTTFKLMQRLARLRVLDDVAGISWPAGKMLFGVDRPMERDPDEPELFTYLDASANSVKELTAKLEAVLSVLRELREQGAEIEDPFDMEMVVEIAPELGKFAEFPTELDFLTENPGGGLTWVGTYGPMSRFERAADQGLEIMERHGFPPLTVSRPMKGGHFGVLRFITAFERDDEEEVERVRRCNSEIVDAVLDCGFIPYKTPAWAIDRVLDRMPPATRDLMQKVHAAVEPLGIMNPGRWNLNASKP